MISAVAALPLTATAQEEQEAIIIEPLFEYPTAPDDVLNLNDRSDYIIEHFWEPLDVKKKEAVNQSALNHAFDVYATAMQWADAEKVRLSVDKLLKRISKNPVLLLQMARSAEESLYGPRANMWIDEIYLPFAKAVVENKKIDKARKLRYERQIRALESSAPGQSAPEFEFTKPDGRQGKYFPMSTPTILFFGDPECFDCRMGKLKLDTDLEFSELVKQGRFNVVYIIPDAEEGWAEKVKDTNPKWSVGSAEDIDELYDLRLTPALFIIDSKGKIKYKNVSPELAVRLAVQVLEEQNNQ